MRLAYLAPDVLEKLVIHRIPPALSLSDLMAVVDLPWTEQMEAVFGAPLGSLRSVRFPPLQTLFYRCDIASLHCVLFR